MASWNEIVVERLKERDAREKLLFEPIVNAHVNLWHSAQQKQRALNKAAHENWEKRVDSLQAELATHRKSQQDVLDLRAQLDRGRLKLREVQLQLEDETRNCDRHREDVTLLREELGRVRKLLEHTENKNRQLAKENFDLIDRVLIEKLTLADQLNEMTQINAALTEKVEKLQQASGDNIAGDDTPTTKLAVAASPSKPNSNTAPASVVVEREPIPSSLSKHCLRIQAHQSEVPTVRYNETGSMVFTCSCDGMIKAWDALDGRLLKTLRTPVDTQLMGMDVKQRVVVGTGSDRAVRLWNLDSERLVHTLIGHASKLYACRLTNDAKTLVTGGTDRKIMTWDVSTGNRVRQISCSSICNAVDVYEHYVVSGHQDSCVRLWDLRSGTMASCMSEVHTNAVTCVEFVSFRAILSNSRDNTLALLDLTAGRVDQRFGNMAYKSAYNWSSAAIASSHKLVGAGGADGKVYFWDAMEMAAGSVQHQTKEITQLRHGTPLVHSGDKRIAAFAFNPTSKGHCASADEDGLLCLWKPEPKEKA